jgi:hypothetical protein
MPDNAPLSPPEFGTPPGSVVGGVVTGGGPETVPPPPRGEPEGAPADADGPPGPELSDPDPVGDVAPEGVVFEEPFGAL